MSSADFAQFRSALATAPLARRAGLHQSQQRFSSTTPIISAAVAATSSSSTPAAALAADTLATASTSPAAAAPVLSSLSSPATDAASILEHAPQTMGYLKSLGIDFGFGTTTVVQSLLESVHVFSGMPWWASIMATVLLVRVVQFPGYCKMSSTAARMKEVQPVLNPLMTKMKLAQKRGDMQEIMQHRQEMQRILGVAGVNRWWLGFPFAQIPVFYGFYKILYNMAEIPVPALTTGGLAWFADLSVADPTHLLPLAASGLIGLQIAFGGEAGATTIAKSVKTAMMIGLPMISFAVAWSWPTALGFYIFVNSGFGVAQTFLLKNASFRKWWGMYPMPVTETPNPLSALNIVRPGIKDSKNIIDMTPKKKQIGGVGSLLDKLTGEKDEEGDQWSIKKMKETVRPLPPPFHLSWLTRCLVPRERTRAEAQGVRGAPETEAGRGEEGGTAGARAEIAVGEAQACDEEADNEAVEDGGGGGRAKRYLVDLRQLYYSAKNFHLYIFRDCRYQLHWGLWIRLGGLYVWSWILFTVVAAWTGKQ